MSAHMATCPNCSALIPCADADLRGTVFCPACGQPCTMPTAATPGPDPPSPAPAESRLVACSICGQPLSPNADPCPHCGHKKPCGMAGLDITGQLLFVWFLLWLLSILRGC